MVSLHHLLHVPEDGAEVAGLEVLNRQGEWIRAPHVPGTFVCNIGDCLMRWNNNTYVSTPQRVRPPAKERYSIAFFLEVNPDSVVDPQDIVKGETSKYEPVTCAIYLAARLNATYEHRKTS
jgi:isopenicillin N synthase-like dioxygenase